ncbi:MAG: protein-L-isoaspartate O-methyltransferase, partial [Pseudomonadota bacterium]
MIEEARKIRMIMGLRRAGITDTGVLSALERVPREVFLPPLFLDQAYDDVALPIGLGQTISQPRVVGYMTQQLELNDRHKVLEIGTGSGYQTAILARLCRRIYS